MESFAKEIKESLMLEINRLDNISILLKEFQRFDNLKEIKYRELTDVKLCNIINDAIEEFNITLLQNDLFDAFADFHISVKELLAYQNTNDVIRRCLDAVNEKIYKIKLEHSKIKDSNESTFVRKKEYELICEELIRILRTDLHLSKTDIQLYQMVSENLGGEKSTDNIKVTIDKHILKYKDLASLLRKRKSAKTNLSK